MMRRQKLEDREFRYWIYCIKSLMDKKVPVLCYYNQLSDHQLGYMTKLKRDGLVACIERGDIKTLGERIKEILIKYVVPDIQESCAVVGHVTPPKKWRDPTIPTSFLFNRRVNDHIVGCSNCTSIMDKINDVSNQQGKVDRVGFVAAMCMDPIYPWTETIVQHALGDYPYDS